MRVKIDNFGKAPEFGEFLGLLLDEHDATVAVVRVDGYGLMLKGLHPSRIVPVTPEQEEAYKP